MQRVNLHSFRIKVRNHKKRLRSFLTKGEKDPLHQLDKMTGSIEKEVWKEVDCLSCGNCCKTKTPTFNKTDIKRISAHFSLTPEAFSK